MLEVTLIPQSCEEHLHARREALPLVVVQVLQSDLVAILWCLYFGQVEVDWVVIAQIDEKLAQSLVLEDGREELVRTVELAEESVLELGTGYDV